MFLFYLIVIKQFIIFLVLQVHLIVNYKPIHDVAMVKDASGLVLFEGVVIISFVENLIFVDLINN